MQQLAGLLTEINISTSPPRDFRDGVRALGVLFHPNEDEPGEYEWDVQATEDFCKYLGYEDYQEVAKEFTQIAQISDPRYGFRFPEGEKSIKTFPPISEPIYGYIFVDQIQLIGDKPFAFNNEYDKIKDIFDEIEWSPKPPSNFPH